MLMWAHAFGHISREVRQWIRWHNGTVKHTGGGRLIRCRLPSKSPWLNPIAPKWVQGKRAVAEPVRPLAVAELMQRICADDHCSREEPIVHKDC
jgi:hypothetical protein